MSPLASKVSVFFRLSWAERWLVLQAAALMPAIRGCTKLVGVQPVARALDRMAHRGSAPATQEGSATVRLVTSCVRIAARNTWSNTCLHRSLTLWWLLRRHGVDSDIRFGARRGPEGLEAHAWVEWHGYALMDEDPAGDYARLDWPMAGTEP